MRVNGKIQLIPYLRVSLLFILGIVVAEYIPAITSWQWMALAIIAFGGLVVSSLPKENSFGKTKSKGNFSVNMELWRGALLLSVIFALGGARMAMERQRMAVELPSHVIAYEAVVVAPPVEKEKVVMCDLYITRADNYRFPRPLLVKASFLKPDYNRTPLADRPLFVYTEFLADNEETAEAGFRPLEAGYPSLKVGDGMEVFSLLTEPTNFEESTFDYARYLKNHGVVATTFVPSDSWLPKQVSLRSLSMVDRARIGALRLRQHISDRYRELGIADDELAVLSAMTIGDKSLLSAEMKDMYSVSGASHVLALSGLHLGIIYAILTLLTMGSRWRRGSQLLIMVAIWTYVMMVGLSLSVVRSALMITVFSLVSILGRSNVSVNSLSIAALVMLCINPNSLFDVGFQMSYMAVLAILLLYKDIYEWVPERWRRWKVVNWLWGMAAVSIAAQIGVAPLIAYYFGRFSVYFLLTNYVVIPAATVILYGAVFMLLCWPFMALQSLIAKLLSAVVWLLNTFLEHMAFFPHASIDNLHPTLLQVVCLYVFFAAMYVVLRYCALAWRFHKKLG